MSGSVVGRNPTSVFKDPTDGLWKTRVEISGGSGGNGLKCIKDVINLTANTPLTLTFSSIASICSHEFSNSGGNVIYLSADITGNQITICSRQDLNNILYKIIGE